MTVRLSSALRVAALALFGAQFAILDGLCLGASPGKLAAWLASGLVWCGLALSVRTRAAQALLALSAALLLAVQSVFFWHYHGFLEVDAATCARRMWTDVAPVILHLLPMTLIGSLVMALV